MICSIDLVYVFVPITYSFYYYRCSLSHVQFFATLREIDLLIFVALSNLDADYNHFILNFLTTLKLFI